MNTPTYKIACPNCGATSGFTETAPSSYSCGYCGSAFEHQTVIAHKTQEQGFYDYFKNLQIQGQQIEDLNPDRNSLWYSIIIQMSSCVEGLAASSFFEEIWIQYLATLNQELGVLQTQGVQVEAPIEKVIARNCIVPTKFYADYALLRAETLAKFKSDTKDLELALQSVKNAEIINQEILKSVDHNITGLKFEILQRLEQTEQFEMDLRTALQHSDTDFVKRLRYRFKEFV